MKKLLILMLVLGIASVVNATTLSWSESAITLPSISATATLTLDADDALPYDWKWVGHTPGTTQYASIAAMATLPAAGPDGGYRDPAQTTYDEWWMVRALDLEFPITIASGPQFDVTIKGLAQGTFSLAAENSLLEVTVLPEPTTVALLGLGGVFMLRRRKK